MNIEQVYLMMYYAILRRRIHLMSYALELRVPFFWSNFVLSHELVEHDAPTQEMPAIKIDYSTIPMRIVEEQQ